MECEPACHWHKKKKASTVGCVKGQLIKICEVITPLSFELTEGTSSNYTVLLQRNRSFPKRFGPTERGHRRPARPPKSLRQKPGRVGL